MLELLGDLGDSNFIVSRVLLQYELACLALPRHPIIFFLQSCVCVDLITNYPHYLYVFLRSEGYLVEEREKE